MSMNLYCNLVNLRQTPSRITNMCMVQPSGNVHWELRGKKARHALQIYIKWCEGLAEEHGVWEDWEDLDSFREGIGEHVKSVRAAMRVKRGLVVQKV